MRLIFALGSLVAGCSGPGKTECLPSEQLDAWVDADGDGYGGGELQRVCALSGEQVDNALDCDDADDTVHPEAEEVCNGRDDDCDGLLDDGFDGGTYYTDADGDGFGVRFPAQFACANPGDGWVRNTDDCDDGDAGRHPGADEVCNGGVDDDCDGRADDGDPALVISTTLRWYRDEDADGFGNPATEVRQCLAPAGFVEDQTDCDDARATVHPDADEVPANGRDENCNLLEGCFDDADVDGARAETWAEVADPQCQEPGHAPAHWPLDCNDADPTVNVDVDWYVDNDSDGYGAGLPVVTQCVHPGGGLVAATEQLDCDDGDDAVYPGALDVCNDGFDTNCDDRDTCASCKDWLGSTGTPVDGVYTVEPEAGGDLFDVWCDMTTDGGGWTLVASTAGVTLDDAAGAWHAELTTTTPIASHPTVWAGMRPVVEAPHDLRFACKVSPASAAMDVDLSFYQVPWYKIITTGSDAQSCFNHNNGQGQTPPIPPMRRNNLTSAVLPSGDQWNAGYLEGEDSCSDSGDFTVDFDDRGMDSNQSDGTDWGEDDSSEKCGSQTASDGGWYIFLRE
jgi:hypothetical protein